MTLINEYESKKDCGLIVKDEPEKVISVYELTKDYGHKRGVFNVSFDICKGECFGFLGPNGAGKTTTIRHIMGFSHPDSGSVNVNNVSCSKNASKLMPQIGYLPGEIAFPESITAKSFLKFLAGLRHIQNLSYCEELLKRFDLNTGGKIRRMSLGQRRKLAVVAAFMHDPAILVLDEPTSGLDPIMQDVFIEFVQKEKQRGKTILLSSHIFDEVVAVCDRISIIKEGRIAAEFSADEIRDGVESEYQGSLLSAILKEQHRAKNEHADSVVISCAQAETPTKIKGKTKQEDEQFPLKTVIETTELTKDYGRGRGVFDIDLKVKNGEVFGLVGTNGSGKTTIIRHLMGFISAQSGKARVLGLDPYIFRGELMHHVSYIPGEIKLPDFKSASDFFDYQEKLYGFKNRRWREELIARLKLDDSAAPRSMSKGMKQKTAIIAALMSDAEILIMDEPTTGLDPVMRDVFISIMREEQSKGKTLFMSSHVFEEIEEICSRVAVIHEGFIVDVLSINDLKKYRSETQNKKRDALEVRFKEIFKKEGE